MTKKDYEKFAKMIKRQKELITKKENPFLSKIARDNQEIRINQIEAAISDIFQADNPDFNPGKFLQACKLTK
jgi:hypothetical protein